MGMKNVASVPMASLNDLEVPRPDVSPKCKALIGSCQTRTVWMSAKVGIIQRLARLQTSSRSADPTANAPEVTFISGILGLYMCWRVTRKACSDCQI